MSYAMMFLIAGFLIATLLWGPIVYIVYTRNQHYRNRQFKRTRRRRR